jgi:hypothetical protein
MSTRKAKSAVAEDLFLYHSIIMRLRSQPQEYRQLQPFYADRAGLLTQLQRMLEAGDITATDLKHGLITDRSLISLA